MRRLRTAKPTAGVSLFPFLAVLLCTMGALIVILVVIARQSRLQAAAVDQDRPRPSAQLVSRVGQLRTARDNTLRQLADQRAQLSRLEDQDRRLRARLAELESAAAQLERTASAAGEREALAAQLAEVRARADAARRQLAEAVEAAGNQSNSFAIIPYDGKRGTRRRPLYIECRADSVVLQPEGIVLTEDDFRGPLGPANPLAAGLRAAGDYLAGSRETSTPAGDPYPLLLVRPDGILAYAAARAAMRSWGDDFGYELIDADWPLEFPAADAAMASRIQEAVEVARRRQRMLARSAPREWRSYDAPNFRHIPPRGGSIADDGWAGGGGRGERGTGGLASPGSGIGGHAGDPLGSGWAPLVGLQPDGSRVTSRRSRGTSAVERSTLVALGPQTVDQFNADRSCRRAKRPALTVLVVPRPAPAQAKLPEPTGRLPAPPARARAVQAM